MYPITDTILQKFQSGNMQYISMTGTGISITNANIMQGSCSINRYVETNESVAIGSTVAAELTFVLNNYNGEWNNTTLDGKELRVRVGVMNGNSVSYVDMGYFIIDEVNKGKNTITVAALDRMVKFDLAVDSSQFTFPYTLTNFLSRLCTLCSVTKGTFTLTNSSYSISALPSEAKTYRDLLRWVCELSGSNAYISYDGKLYLGWYGTTSQFTTTTANRLASEVDENTFSLTGVTILAGDNTKYTAGTNTRPITINNNPFIPATQAQSVANTLNTKLGGFSYCPFSATMLPSPQLFPMDRGTFTKADGTTVAVSITEVTFKLNGTTQIGCRGEMAVRGRTYGRADQTFYASNIAAGAVTADKISVDDLNALNATIAGWAIGSNAISKTVNGKTASLSSSVPQVLMMNGHNSAVLNGNAEIMAQRYVTNEDNGYTLLKGRELSQSTEIWEVHAMYADYVEKNQTSLVDGTLTLKGKDIDPDTQFLEDNFKTMGLSYKDITFGGDSLKRLSPNITQVWSTAIPSNKNLNTIAYLVVGQYFVATNAIAQTLTNCPTRYAFYMTVESPISASYDEESGSGNFYRVRTIVNFYGDKWVQRSVRSSGTVTYGAWRQVMTDDLAVAKSGDTMTGALDVSNASIGITGATAERSFKITGSGGLAMSLIMSGGGNQGIYSSGYASSPSATQTADGKWIIYRTSGNNVFVPLWGGIGSNTTPVYMNSNGKPAAMTATTGTPTKNSTYVGTGSIKWTRFGRVVHLQGSFYAKSALGNGGGVNLFTGAPAANSDCECVAIPTGDTSVSISNVLPIVIDTSGNVIANFSGSRRLDEDCTFVLDTTYIAAS